jgi:Flp pilus assembly protein TadB
VERADHREGSPLMMPLLLLAAALLVAPPWAPGVSRLDRLRTSEDQPGRSRRPTSGLVPSLAALATGLLIWRGLGNLPGVLLGAPVAVAVALSFRRLINRTPASAPDPLRLAGGWDLLAACLRSGLPVPLAVRAIAHYMPGEAGSELSTVADRLVLGADPATAWDVPAASSVHRLARAARRSARTGASLANVAEAAAAELRAGAQDVAAARGQRAGVLITGPLGLCFLPAFLALGVVPVVIGLASGLEVAW